MKRIILAILLVTCIGCIANAQLNFVYIPEVNAKTVDGLSLFQMQNLTGKSLTGNIIITARENTNKKDVVTIKTPVITIAPGVSSFPRGVFSGSAFMFPANNFARIVSQTRTFIPGEYTFCFRFIPQDKMGDEYESCFDGSIQPLVPISLITPADKDTICQKRPVLSWQPPMPFNASMRFRLLLTEKKGRSSMESLLTNAPLVLLDNITTTTINYPSTSPELKEGKTYCWQVIAYQQGVIISRSEVWEFTVLCKEIPPVSNKDSYRDLRSLVNGNYYIANYMLRFAFTNDYSAGKLRYTILDASNGMKEVKGLPEVKLARGINKVDLDLSSLGLEPGKSYVFKAYPFNENEIVLQFTYQEKSENE